MGNISVGRPSVHEVAETIERKATALGCIRIKTVVETLEHETTKFGEMYSSIREGHILTIEMYLPSNTQ